jgi:hypothetical protein
VRLVLAVVAFAMLGAMGHAQSATSNALARIDHLVYATPDLQFGIDAIEKQLV